MPQLPKKLQAVPTENAALLPQPLLQVAEGPQGLELSLVGAEEERPGRLVGVGRRGEVHESREWLQGDYLPGGAKLVLAVLVPGTEAVVAVELSGAADYEDVRGYTSGQ